MTELEKYMNYADYIVIDDVDFPETDVEKIIESFNNRKDVILYGPPGTGKTYLLDLLFDKLGGRIGLYEKIQFHSNYSYDEFIEGIIPDIENGGFKYEDGVFLKFCKEASDPAYREKLNIFFIDEINRANITAVFGEVLNLIENKGDRKLKTSKTHQEIQIPPNVFIIGTMNTADKSLGRLDFALRRRFRFLPVFPSHTILSRLIAQTGFSADCDLDVETYVKCFKALNAKIVKHPLLGKDLTLGHVLWVPQFDGENAYKMEDIGDVFRETVFPQLESYIGSNADVLAYIVGNKISDAILYGKKISNQDVLDFIKLLANNKIVEA